jgi:hypothetical protein
MKPVKLHYVVVAQADVVHSLHKGKKPEDQTSDARERGY